MTVIFIFEGKQIARYQWPSPPRVGELFSSGRTYTVQNVEWVPGFTDSKGFVHKGPRANVYLQPGRAL